MLRCLPLLIAAVAVLAAGCGDDIQFAAPPKKDAAAAGGPRGRMPAGHPPVGGGERIDPHGGLGATPAAAKDPDPFADAADAGKTIKGPEGENAVPAGKVWYTGRVELDPAVKLPGTYALFVCAGPAPKPRVPVLSRKYEKPTFPFTFELRQQDMAFGDTKVDQPLALYLIFSEAGYVMPQSGAYFKSAPTDALPLESKDVVLILKQP